jgi:hypothetical protein
MRVGLGNSAPALGDGSLKLRGSGHLRPMTVPVRSANEPRSSFHRASDLLRPALAGVRWISLGHLLAFRKAAMRSAEGGTVTRP